MFEPTSTWPNLDLVNFSHALAYIRTTDDFQLAKQAILSNVWTDFNLTQFRFWSTFDSEQCLNWLQLDLILPLVNFWYELGKIMTRYDFLDARFVIWLAIDLLLLLVNISFWAKNDQIWLPEARCMIFSNIRTDFNLIFVQFSVARKLILNGGAIRPTGLLYINIFTNKFHTICII